MFYRLRRKLSGRMVKRYILTITMIVVVFVMSLGYAALSQYMEIEGMAIIEKRWNVAITDVTVTSTNSGTGVKSFDTGATVVSLDTTLPNLTSTVTYTITFTNSGNVKGKLYAIDKIEDENTNITYTISGLEVGTTIAASSIATATVTVQYKSGVTSISTEPKRMMLGFNFVEDTSSGGSSGGGTSTGTTLSSKILSDNTAYADNTSSTYVSASTGIDFNAINSDTNGKGLYYTSTNTEDSKTTYYFRGDITNNYVKFANYYWRIVRINEDGSIRLIYNGPTTGTGDEMISLNTFNDYDNDNAYLGYMYGTVGVTNYDYSLTHANTNNSNVKKVLDEWYENNLKTNYSSYLADAGFCNDRSESSATSGAGTDPTEYDAYLRLDSGMAAVAGISFGPQFACPQTNDLFTTSSSSKGNKALDYPIGLITADEVAYAGASLSAGDNKNFYLYAYRVLDDEYTLGGYWTMTPHSYYGSDAIGTTVGAALFYLGYFGEFSYAESDSTSGIRPVINLKSTVTLSSELPSGCTKQDGTASCPYIVYTN